MTATGYGSTGTSPKGLTLDRASFNQGKNAQYDFEISDKGVNSPLVAKGPSAVAYGISSYNSEGMKSSNPNIGFYEADTSRTLDANGGNPACNQGGIAIVESVAYGINGDIAGTLDSSYYKGCGMRSGVERDVVAVDCRTRYIVRRLTPLECERLQGYPDGWTLIGEPKEVDVPDYIEEFDETKFNPPNYEDFGLSWEDINEFNQTDEEEIFDEDYIKYLKAYEEARAKATKKIKIGSHKETHYFYTDSQGKRVKCSDAARYKALGNSIAIPPWKWVLKRLCACYERDATMASLFDGIGGFPYIWEQLNGKGSCLWASEIEEFPMAVTKVRIGE